MVEQHYITPVLRHPDRPDLYFFYVLDVLFPFMIQVSDTGHVIPEPDTRGLGLKYPLSYKSLNYIHLTLALNLAH